jgi:predicted MFS family arabinose efflux permease
LGFGGSQWTVAQNVEGTAVEQQLGRSVMSRFHASFSLGTVTGALGGAAANALHMRPIAHLTAIAISVAIVGQLSTRGFLNATESRHHKTATGYSPWKAWTEPRTLLIGLFVLCVSFAEGTGTDWLGVATVDGYNASAATGSFVYVAFVAAMTTGRWFGPRILDRYGRVPVLRAGALSSMAGVLVVVFGPNLATAFAGVVVWGLGIALGFPTGMSAAADEPALAAIRVSAVSAIGFAALLAGPSLIGAIGDHIGVRRALLLNAGALALGSLFAGSTRPPPTETKQERPEDGNRSPRLEHG